MEKNSFVFYKDWKKAIEDLPDDIRLEIYESIIEYATTGNLRGLKPMAKIAFNFIKTDIDRDTEKYMSIVERNKANIGKRWNKNDTKNTTGKNGIPNDTKNTDNDNDNDNDLNLSPNGDSETAVPPPPENPRKINYQEIINLYHTYCPSLSKVEVLNDDRRKKIKSRIIEFEKQFKGKSYLKGFEYIFKKMESSEFLTGVNDRNWKADFDWFFSNNTNYIKVYEGKFDNRKPEEKPYIIK